VNFWIFSKKRFKLCTEIFCQAVSGNHRIVEQGIKLRSSFRIGNFCYPFLQMI
jgi:hypothetical protein